MKQQTKRFFSMILGLGLLAAAIVIYFHLIKPAYEESQQIKSRLLSQQTFLNYETSAIKQVKNLIDSYQSQAQIQETVSLALPQNEDVASAIGQIYGLLQASGLNLQSVSISPSPAPVSRQAPGVQQGPLQSPPQKPVSSLSFQIKASGSYENLKDFVDKLAKNIRIFDLKNLTIQPALPGLVGKITQDLFSLDFSVATYYQSR